MHELLTSREKTVSHAIARRLGAAGVSMHGDHLREVRDSFADDPKNVLAVSREHLLSIGSDKSLSPEVKDKTLDEELDTIFDLTIKLDHEVFPPTSEVQKGVPEYIPDGFVDMGGDASRNASARNREQILVDKREILSKYKPFLKDLLSEDYGSVDLQTKKRYLATETAKEIYFNSMPYNYEALENMGGDVVKLSEISEGVCSHQALAFQVLCQTLGLKSRILKADRNNVRHSTNMIRVDERWYIFDVSSPDFMVDAAGKKVWKPGAFKVDRPPAPGERKRYDVKGRYSGKPITYRANHDMYWRIDPMK